jgi:hypothetical protein
MCFSTTCPFAKKFLTIFRSGNVEAVLFAHFTTIHRIDALDALG